MAMKTGVLVAAWGLLQIGCTAYPTAPADPAYDTDVRPIFLAHCTRCHGDGPDGGMLNIAPFANTGTSVRPSDPCLTQFGNNSNSLDCQYGAANYSGPMGSIITDIHSTEQLHQMPPQPAPRLNEFELGVIEAWASKGDPTNNVLPLCSRSSNPDPALLCPTK